MNRGSSPHRNTWPAKHVHIPHSLNPQNQSLSQDAEGAGAGVGAKGLLGESSPASGGGASWETLPFQSCTRLILPVGLEDWPPTQPICDVCAPRA